MIANRSVISKLLTSSYTMPQVCRDPEPVRMTKYLLGAWEVLQVIHIFVPKLLDWQQVFKGLSSVPILLRSLWFTRSGTHSRHPLRCCMAILPFFFLLFLRIGFYASFACFRVLEAEIGHQRKEGDAIQGVGTHFNISYSGVILTNLLYCISLSALQNYSRGPHIPSSLVQLRPRYSVWMI